MSSTITNAKGTAATVPFPDNSKPNKNNSTESPKSKLSKFKSIVWLKTATAKDGEGGLIKSRKHQLF